MTDIRANLNRRRDDLRPRLAEAHDRIHRTVIGSPAYEGHRQVIEEVAAIEATLATMQLADAQREVARAQHEVATAQETANQRADVERNAREDEAYWLRKFMTNITIANGAGLAAGVLFMIKSDSPLVEPEVVTKVVTLFSIGTIMGGALPLLALLGTAGFKQITVAAIERFAWARPLRHLYHPRAMMLSYAAVATLALLGACFTAITSASKYYEGRAALSSPAPSKVSGETPTRGGVPAPRATASAPD